MRALRLTPLPAFNDNYIWLLDDGAAALVVDPGDACPVRTELKARNLKLQAILVTHHHGDHTGGVTALREATGCTVWGPATEPIPEPYTPVRGNEAITALGLSWHVIDVPGHTAGHVAYFCEAVNDAPVLFCGDTLFSAGCGRLFEGTPAQMLASLDALARLPDNTRVCAAHEYTLSNLRFALAVEPQNQNTIDHQAHCLQRREAGQPTLPSTLALERAINPFLRSRNPTVVDSVLKQAAYGDAAPPMDDVAIFAALREWKNRFA